MKRIRTRWEGLNSLTRLRIMAIGALVLIGVVPSLLALASGEDFSGFLLNFGTEMLGALVTFVVFDLLISSREKHEESVLEQEKRKEDLIAQLGSRINEEAIRAAEELERHGWLQDGSLRGIIMDHPNLRGAILVGVDLKRAVLFDANLSDAVLVSADLRGAELPDVNLQGTHLTHTKLVGTRLDRAQFDANTILPDGNHYDPDLGPEQLERFTDPDHPDFWRPEPGSAWWYPAKEDNEDTDAAPESQGG